MINSQLFFLKNQVTVVGVDKSRFSLSFIAQSNDFTKRCKVAESGKKRQFYYFTVMGRLDFSTEHHIFNYCLIILQIRLLNFQLSCDA